MKAAGVDVPFFILPLPSINVAPELKDVAVTTPEEFTERTIISSEDPNTTLPVRP